MLHLGDITKIDGRTAPVVDCVIGGSPCQDLSVAGKRAGLDGSRSGLFMEQLRIIKEMREERKKVVMQQLGSESQILLSFVSADNNGINVSNNGVNAGSYTEKRLDGEDITTTTTTLSLSACAQLPPRDNIKDAFAQILSDRGCDQLPPCELTVAVYIRESVFNQITMDEAYSEAEKFVAYNALRGWDCMPEWKLAANLWIARMEENK